MSSWQLKKCVAGMEWVSLWVPPCPCTPPECPELHTESPSQADHNFSFHKDAACDFPIVQDTMGVASSQEAKRILQRTKTFSSSPTPQNCLACGCGVAKDTNTLQKPGQKRHREISAAHEVYQEHGPVTEQGRYRAAPDYWLQHSGTKSP